MPQVPADEPVILPLVRPAPEPLLRVWKTYLLEGRRYRMVGERWREADLHRLAFDCDPDRSRPGTAFSWRMFDLETGQLIEPASDELAWAVPGTRSPRPGA